MRGIIAAVAAAAGIAASIMGGGVAQADDTSFLDAVGPGMYGPAAQLGLGRYACDQLHGGMAPQDVRGPAPWTPIGPEIVAAAQRELCPDTLPR